MPRPQYARIAVLVVFAIVLYLVYRILEPFLPALVWAAILATVFYPLFSFLSRRMRHPRLASALTCVILTVVIVLPALFLILVLAKESVVAYKALEEDVSGGGPASLSALQKTSAYQWFLAKSRSLGMPEPGLSSVAPKGIGIVSEFLVSRSAKIFSRITRSVINFLVMLFGLYYFLLRGPDMLRALRELSLLQPENGSSRNSTPSPFRPLEEASPQPRSTALRMGLFFSFLVCPLRCFGARCWPSYRWSRWSGHPWSGFLLWLITF
jgi:predicted PurR-regulated permease PerM